ncbi:MAG: CDP-alcohol phosphatidyltransferase family protein [Phycisphaeraceae bacterium]
MLRRKNIPNLLTMLRLVLAGVFFAILAYYRFDDDRYPLLLPAIGLFIAAALTDALDGYFARRWQVESKFGRIMDPFCDKVLVLGALVFLAGPAFSYETWVYIDNMADHTTIRQVSGFTPWMVVVIIARELLVTGIRGELEGSGHKFGANLWGKLKMMLQSVVVPIVLFIVYLIDSDFQWHRHFMLPRDVLVYATVIVTVLSGLPYVTGAYRVSKSGVEAR